MNQSLKDMLAKFGAEDLREGSRSVGHCGVDTGDWEDYAEVPISALARIQVALLAAPQPVAINEGGKGAGAPIGYINPDDLAKPITALALHRARNSMCGISMPVYAAPQPSAKALKDDVVLDFAGEHGLISPRSNEREWSAGFNAKLIAFAGALLTAEQPSEDKRDTAAARDVLAERRRQVEAEGWTPEHDDEHDGGEMGEAAAVYALHAAGWPAGSYAEFWPAPWSRAWFKPTQPRRDLVKAAALILAEIERIDRAPAARGDA